MVFRTFLITHLAVIIILDPLFGLCIDNSECRKHHRSAFLTFVDRYHRQLLAILIGEGLAVALLILTIVQSRDAVECGITCSLPAILLLLKHENDTVHAVILSSVEISGQLSSLRREPRLLPVALQIGDFLNHQLGKLIQGSVLS